MKISKLFHWLYAILMLLPAFAIGVTCAYAIFNKNAYQSYSDNYVESETQLSNVNQLIENQNYIINYVPYETTSYNYIPYISYNQISINWNDYTTQDTTNVISFRMRTNDNFLQLRRADNTTINIPNVWGNTLKTFTFNFKSREYDSTTQLYNLSLIGIVYEQNKLDNVFYYSIDKIQQNPLFNWAYDSFLATPITYITGLFGIASDHIAVMLMSYWLAISVIWLVFDMVMYVPLLVHRWIDKGVLE